MKICTKCNIEKSLTDFHKRGNGYQAWCKICKTKHKAGWIVNNRDKVKQNNLWSKYRLRLEDWQKMWNDQNGKCALCKDREPTIVDHNHACCSGPISCGKCVRALVCNRCNILLGVLECNSELVSEAYDYLKK